MTLKARVIPCLDVKDGRVVKGVNFVDLSMPAIRWRRRRPMTRRGGRTLLPRHHRLVRRPRHDLRRRRAHRRAVLHAADRRRRRAHRRGHPQAAAGRCRQGLDQHGRGEEAGIRRREPPTSSATSASSSPSTRRRCPGTARRIAGRSSPMAAASATGIDAVEFARKVVARGAGEILLTSMDRDGTKSGYDIALTRAIADAVRVPVIASGGVGTLDHLVEGMRDGHATAVLAASIFHFGTYTIAEAKPIWPLPASRCASTLSGRPARRKALEMTAFHPRRSGTDRRRAGRVVDPEAPGRRSWSAGACPRPPRSSARKRSRRSSPR